MRLQTLVSSVVLGLALVVSSSSFAQSSASVTGATSPRGRGIGLGAAQMLDSGRTNLLLSYGPDSGRFHVEGLLGMSRNFDNSGTPNTDTDTTSVNFGGRFWYHLHAAHYADFSMGGGLLVETFRQGGYRYTDFLFDLGAQIRAFIVPNVALLGTLGIGLNFRDGESDQLLIGGKPLGSVGIAYFFE